MENLITMKNQRVYDDCELRQLQAVEIQILEEIIRICNKHNLRWFVVYGTALGTVRHQGFIPWDDDIDIGMLREDYDKFVKVASNELSKGFSMCHYSVDEKVAHYFVKIRKDDTLFVEESSRRIRSHQGIFVDVFSFDNVPDDKDEKRKHIHKMWKYNKLFVNKSIAKPCDNGTGVLKYFFKNCIKKITKLATLAFSKKYFYKKLDNVVQKYKFADCKSVIQSVTSDLTELDKDDIFPTVKMKFENIYVEVPRNYDKILKGNYGNYMELPPENKRINHAPIKLAFTEEECNDYYKNSIRKGGKK